MSYTLSELQADFGHGAAHVKASASPYIEFEFGSTPPRVFKSTMVKHGGSVVAWQQPVLLTGANSTNLTVIAKMHKTLTADKTIGSGSIDLGMSAGQNGFTVVPLRSTTGASAGEVRFIVTQGEAPGVAGIKQGTPGSDGIIEGVGGPGRNVDGGLPAAGGLGGAGAGGIGNQGGQPGYGQPTGVLGGQPGAGGIGSGQGYASQPVGAGYGQQPGSGVTGTGYGEQGGIGGDQQLASVGQQGIVGGQQGGMPGGVGSGGSEFHEKRTHNVHDHDENETSEVRHIG